MPKRSGRRGSTGRESGWLTLSDSQSTGGDTAWVAKAIDFPILAFDSNFNTIEIYKIQVDQITGNNGAYIAIGSKSWSGVTTTFASVGIDRTTLWGAAIPTGITSQTFDVTDDLGQGLMMPADRIVWNVKNSAGTAQTFILRVFYRLRKSSDHDLVTMLNQFIVQIAQ